MMRRTYALISGLMAAFLLLAPQAQAQRTPVYQSGTMVSGDLSKFVTNGLMATAGGLGGDALGAGVNPFAISDRAGVGLALVDGPTSGPHRALRFGHDADGNALLQIEALNGADEGGFNCDINGSVTSCFGVSPLSTVVIDPASVLGNLNGFAANPITVHIRDLMRVADNAALATAETATYPAGVWRDDYATGNGAPPLWFLPQTGTCTAAGMRNDGGSCVDGPSGNSWIAQHPASGADAREWGFKKGADVTQMFRDAVYWACKVAHAKVVIPYFASSAVDFDRTAYKISSPIVIGDSDGTNWSSYNTCAIEGVTPVNDITKREPMMFLWTGTRSDDPVLFVNGPISHISIKNIGIECNGACTTGFRFLDPIFSSFEDLAVRTWAGGSTPGDFPCMIIDNRITNSTESGNEDNRYKNLYCSQPVLGTDADGIRIGLLDSTGGTHTVIRDIFENVGVNFDRTAGDNWGIKIGTAHGLTFINPYVFGDSGGSNGTGLVISPPTGRTQVPSNITMISPRIVSVSSGVGWIPYNDMGIDFINWDESYAAIPVCNYCRGTTARGKNFGYIGFPDGGEVNGSGYVTFGPISDGTSKMLIGGAFASNTATNALYVKPTLSFSNTDTQIGINSSPTFTPTGGSLSNGWGTYSSPSLAGAAISVSSFGGYVAAPRFAGYTHTVLDGYGFRSIAPTAGLFPITNYHGFKAEATGNGNGVTSGTIQNNGLTVTAETAAAGSGGTVLNTGLNVLLGTGTGAGATQNIGLRISGNGGSGGPGTTSNYAVYADSTAPNMFTGNVLAGGSLPVLTSCGVGPSVVGDAKAGEVTMGTGSPTSCVITFATPYANTPYCTVTWQNPPATHIYTVSAGAIQITQTGTSSNKLNYVCWGRSSG